MSKKVSESIFNWKIVIPMADVSHIEKRFLTEKETHYECYKWKKEWDLMWITIVTKHTTWNSEQDSYNNPIWLTNEAQDFLKAWCVYRRELEWNIK